MGKGIGLERFRAMRGGIDCQNSPAILIQPAESLYFTHRYRDFVVEASIDIELNNGFRTTRSSADGIEALTFVQH